MRDVVQEYPVEFLPSMNKFRARVNMTSTYRQYQVRCFVVLESSALRCASAQIAVPRVVVNAFLLFNRPLLERCLGLTHF